MLERGCLCLLLGSLRSEHGSRIRVMPRAVPVCSRLTPPEGVETQAVTQPPLPCRDRVASLHHTGVVSR
jgi:hypothetical protein